MVYRFVLLEIEQVVSSALCYTPPMKPLVLAALFVLALATAVPAHAQTAPAPAPATGISTPSGAEIAKLEADVVRLGGKPVRWGYPASEVCGYEDYRS